MFHAIKVSDAFQLVDVGPKSPNSRTGKGANNSSGRKDQY